MNTSPPRGSRLREVLLRNRFFVGLTLGIIFMMVILVFMIRRNVFFSDSDDYIPADGQDSLATDSIVIRVAFLGDLMGHMPVVNSTLNKETGVYEFDKCFSPLQPYLTETDFVIGNLETTFGDLPYHGFPMFSSPDDYAPALIKAGFDFLVTANNHSVDRGKKGIERTIHVLDSFQLSHTGTFVDNAARNRLYPAITEVQGIRLCILNYTYGTNGLPVPKPSVVNMMDTVQMQIDLEAARKLQPDIIITFLHWGVEYARKPSDEQRAVARFLARHGCHAVIGAHPHVVQTFESLTGKDSISVPVFYSIGNCLSNQRDRYKDGGIIAEITISKVRGKAQISGSDYISYWVYKKMNPNSYKLVPEGYTEKNPGIFSMSSADTTAMGLFFRDTRKNMQGAREKKLY